MYGHRGKARRTPSVTCSGSSARRRARGDDQANAWMNALQNVGGAAQGYSGNQAYEQGRQSVLSGLESLGEQRGHCPGGLLLPRFDPSTMARSMNRASWAARSRSQGQTALLDVADLKAEAGQPSKRMCWPSRTIRRCASSSLAARPLARLPTTGGPPAAGPLTQQSTMPGQPPGAPTVVPGGQDLSRFANVPPTGGGPIPPNVMGAGHAHGDPTARHPDAGDDGPQGACQDQPQAPQNPLLEMAGETHGRR